MHAPERGMHKHAGLLGISELRGSRGGIFAVIRSNGQKVKVQPQDSFTLVFDWLSPEKFFGFWDEPLSRSRFHHCS